MIKCVNCPKYENCNNGIYFVEGIGYEECFKPHESNDEDDKK